MLIASMSMHQHSEWPSRLIHEEHSETCAQLIEHVQIIIKTNGVLHGPVAARCMLRKSEKGTRSFEKTIVSQKCAI